jgi:hypothetical protein
MGSQAARMFVVIVGLFITLERDALAVSYELRGVGTLPTFGSDPPPAGVVGEDITVSVMLNSEDFDYQVVANPIFHYFVPNKTVPVEIVGSTYGTYPNVSPISRFVALELTHDDPPGDDQIGIDVSAGNTTTALIDLWADDGDGFDGDVTPFNSEELFTIFAEAMADELNWTRSQFASVFIGMDSLYLGTLDWELIHPNQGPTQMLNIEPTFDVQLKPGNAFPIGNATAATLDIDGGAGTSFPVLEVLLDFPLNEIPEGAQITSAKLKLDAATSSSSITIQALGYAGDGLASLSDEIATTTLVGSNAGPFTSTGDILIDLNAEFIESLLNDSSHLGLRLKSATSGPFIRIATSETVAGTAPTLMLEFSGDVPGGDFNLDGMVDGTDFLAWQRGESPVLQSSSDLEAWRAQYGLPATSAAAAAVPEPTAISLAALALCGLGVRRRRP